MNNKNPFNETEYLNKLFTKSTDEATDFPLVDVPENLSNELYDITELSSLNEKNKKSSSWTKFTSIAASILMAVVLLQVYEHHQTIKQLEHAQADLATALHYLGEANKITRAQMFNALNNNMQKAAIAPIIEIGRDVANPTIQSIESATKTSNRTL